MDRCIAASLAALVMVACGPGAPPVQEPAPPPVVAPQPVTPPPVSSDVQSGIAGLKSPDASVRHESAKFLVGLGEEAVGPLLETLATTGLRNVKMEICWALGEIGDARAAGALVVALNDPDGGVSAQAAGALAKLGSAAVDVLLPVLETGSPQARAHAARILGKSGDPRAIPALVFAMPWTPEAVDVLGGLGEPAVDALIEALGSPDVTLRARAAEALGLTGEPRAVKPLVAALSDGFPAVRRSAVVALGQIGVLEAVEPLLGVLDDADAEVVAAACTVLGGLGDEAAVDGLLGLLVHWEPEVRAAAVASLGLIGGDVDPGPVNALLSDDHVLVQQNAVVAAGALADPSSIEPLVALLDDVDKWVPGLAAEALAAIGKPAVKPLLAATSSPDAQTRLHAAWALGEIGDKGAVKRLVKMLGDPDDEVALSASDALVAIGEPAVPRLVKALDSHLPLVPELAMETLRAISGLDLGTDPKQWKDIQSYMQ